jgi:hypothetical protein
MALHIAGVFEFEFAIPVLLVPGTPGLRVVLFLPAGFAVGPKAVFAFRVFVKVRLARDRRAQPEKHAGITLSIEFRHLETKRAGEFNPSGRDPKRGLIQIDIH